MPQRQSGGWFTIPLMLMEDAMNHYTEIVVILLATVLSFPAVWYAASSGFVA